MRYVSRYLSHDTIRITILESRYDTYHDTSLMLRLIDYQAKITKKPKDKRPDSDQLLCFITISFIITTKIFVKKKKKKIVIIKIISRYVSREKYRDISMRR